MALIVGLTGGIASGKSTVSSMLMSLNIPVIDADKISRDVVEPGEDAYEEIRRVFSDDILQEDLTLNRKKLGKIIFADEEKRKQLNAIVHPAVRKEMLLQRDTYLNAGAKCVILDIPLLFEGNLTSLVDKTLVVSVNENIQLDRLMQRDNYTKAEAKQRIHSQMPIQEKVKLADEVINNNGSKDQSYQQLENILKKWAVI